MTSGPQRLQRYQFTILGLRLQCEPTLHCIQPRECADCSLVPAPPLKETVISDENGRPMAGFGNALKLVEE